ncbi:MAG TPA: ribonuclease M5 [Candidatus Izemoplasmatales bacterium]|nr:ribonuclease M5 [Candidatus Izemoplasmatales bacterium]
MWTQIVVVEGLHDRQKLQSIYPGIDCLVTNGSEILEATMELIEQAHRNRGVILFLDPDHPGKRITQKILERVPGAGIAFLNKKDAISKNGRKVGVEHASETDIREALDHWFQTTKTPKETVPFAALAELGLMNRNGAADRRQKACESLRIPWCNGKTFWKTVNMLEIPLSRIIEVIS